MYSEQNPDVLSVGKLVVDFISDEQTDTLGNATTFRRYLGGSPANIAVLDREAFYQRLEAGAGQPA